MNLPHGRPHRWLKIGKIILGLLIVTALVAVIFRERQTLARGLDMSLGEFVSIASFSVATWIVTSVVQVATLRALSAPIAQRTMFALHAATGLLNHVPGRPGTLFRAGYLKRHAGLSYTHFGSVALVNILVITAVSGLTGALTTALGYGLSDPPRQGLFVGFLALSAVGAAPLLFAPRFAMTRRWGVVWNQLIEGRDRILAHPRLLLTMVVCYLLSFLFSAVRFMAAFHALGIEVGFVGCLVLGAVGRLSILLGITPGALGIHELVVATCASLLGISFATAVVAGTLVRAVLIVCYIAIGLPALVLLRRSEPQHRRGESGQHDRD